MMYRIAWPVVALVVAGTCSERDPISPVASAAQATLKYRDRLNIA
jgi:hypothetical protein